VCDVDENKPFFMIMDVLKVNYINSTNSCPWRNKFYDHASRKLLEVRATNKLWEAMSDMKLVFSTLA
jgi:hypothetical protein